MSKKPTPEEVLKHFADNPKHPQAFKTPPRTSFAIQPGANRMAKPGSEKTVKKEDTQNG